MKSEDILIKAINNYINPESSYSGNFSYGFDGEKTPYELGAPIDFEGDYYALRLRAWEAFLKTDVVQNAIRKYCLWIIGSGLKLQSDPITDSKLKSNFVTGVEKSFRLFADLKASTLNENQNLHYYGAETMKTALLSGDALCVNSFKSGRATLNAYDGYLVTTPVEVPDDKTIVDGVELDKNGRHIAYYLQKDDFSHVRIPARNSKGQTVAWLFYGMKYKLNDVRGISLLTAVMETVAKLDRYKSATVGTAEENAKIPYTIEHDQFSTGENPLINQVAQSFGKGKGVAPETENINGLASKIAQTTEKQVYNMPIGATFKRNNFQNDLTFSEFFGTNVDIVYATLGMPPEVALDKFGGSYSGSRAALKSWEYKMLVDRKLLIGDQFYRPFYEFWLDMQVLTNKIDNPEYLRAFFEKDFMTLAEWRKSRFIGVTVPHIDPVKEVKAERMKLGEQFDSIPLSTAEQSCEALNSGDYDTVQTVTTKELKNGNRAEVSEETGA